MVARMLAGFVRPPEPRTFPPLHAANLPPMRGRIEIIRGGYGLPHIYAEKESDLYAALGYLQADRFFFIDTIRHLGAGRLCELIGNLRAPKRSGLLGGRCVADLDSFVRPLGFETQ